MTSTTTSAVIAGAAMVVIGVAVAATLSALPPACPDCPENKPRRLVFLWGMLLGVLLDGAAGAFVAHHSAARGHDVPYNPHRDINCGFRPRSKLDL